MHPKICIRQRNHVALHIFLFILRSNISNFPKTKSTGHAPRCCSYQKMNISILRHTRNTIPSVKHCNVIPPPLLCAASYLLLMMLVYYKHFKKKRITVWCWYRQNWIHLLSTRNRNANANSVCLPASLLMTPNLPHHVYSEVVVCVHGIVFGMPHKQSIQLHNAQLINILFIMIFCLSLSLSHVHSPCRRTSHRK